MQIGMIDTLEISFDVISYNEVFKNFIQRLENAKSLSQYNKNMKGMRNSTIELKNQVFEVLSNGGVNHAYILQGDLFEIKFSQGRSMNVNFFPIVIKAKSVGLWSKSPETMCADMFALIRSINEDVDIEINERIKRVDLCCHTNEFYIDNKSLEKFQGRYMSNNIRLNSKTIETYELGARGNPVFCRIYNKSREVLKKRDKLWFFEVWKKHGLIDNDIWNIEFELKRKFLNEVGINTVYDLFTKIKGIWNYCTHEWLQHKNLIYTRIERCPVSEQWQVIQSAFDSYVGMSFISRNRQSELNAMGILPTIIGYVTTFGASFEDMDIKETLNTIFNQGSKYLGNKNTDYESEIERKRKMRKEIAQ